MDVRQDEGWIWSTVQIETADGHFQLGGISKRRAPEFVTSCINHLFTAQSEPLYDLHQQIQQLESADHYIGDRHLRPLRNRLNDSPFHLLERDDLIAKIDDSSLHETIQALQSFADPTEREQWKAECNERFIEQASENELFDVIEKNKLTPEQRRAALIDEDNNLVVAAAGSGKTSVIVAKVAYLLEKGLCRPDEILLLSFTKASTSDLQERLRERLREHFDEGIEVPEVKTFHSLGNQIVGHCESPPPTVPKEAEERPKKKQLIREIIDQLRADPDFTSTLLNYFQSHFATYRNPFEFTSWTDYIDYVRNQNLITLKGDNVKSFEECEIANFLYLQNVNYEYECAYPHLNGDESRRSYKPDFCLPDDVYLEHFALGHENRLPDFMTQFEKSKYLQDMEWKHELHERKRTTLITTYSYERFDGKLLDNLEHKLSQHGVELVPRDQENVFAELERLGRVDQFTELVADFMDHVRSNRLGDDELRQKAETWANFEAQRAHAFLDLFRPIRRAYEAWLEDNSRIDFHGMINRAADHVEAGRYSSPYKYILVDEFQDIARSRAQLLRALKGQREDAVLHCVGDDWQSIFRFAGSDVAIMRNFEQPFGPTEHSYLTQTFRCNTEITQFATRFILQNPSQIEKQVSAQRVSDGPAVQIGIHDHEDREQLIERALDRIADHAAGQAKHVLVLGRYKGSSPDDMSALKHKYDNLKVEDSTIHKAKGREADYVIFVGLDAQRRPSEGTYGFPTDIADDPIIELAMPQIEDFPHAEDRRLFYVGATRAKDRAFLIGPKRGTSRFLEEVINRESHLAMFGHDYHSDPACPRCRTGRLVERESNGNRFMGCTHHPYCHFTFNLKLLNHCPCCGGEVTLKGPGYRLECVNGDFSETTKACPRCRAGILIHRQNSNTGEWFKSCSNFRRDPNVPNCRNSEDFAQQP
ncbi:MAG: UvrD-helicase domain-containing protein [Salinibacter sp.]